MSRETLADRYGLKVVWKSASGTVHTTDDCYRLSGPRARYTDVPADSIPVGFNDRCVTCWADLEDPSGGEPEEIVGGGSA